MDTTELHKGRDKASASPVTLTAEQKEKINKAIVQAIVDETGQPQHWFSVSWGRDSR
jgi:hypothetical protein